ncbi:MAG: hypothetical protein WBV28_10270 [Terracidiphilus sp.]
MRIDEAITDRCGSGTGIETEPGWPGMLENKKAKLIVVSRDSYRVGDPSEARQTK